MDENMNVLLQRLKVDLGIMNSTAYDERFTSLLNVAKSEIEREGVVLDLEKTDDGELLVDYARQMWLSRRGENPESAMARSLRYRINNRLFGKERTARSEVIEP